MVKEFIYVEMLRTSSTQKMRSEKRGDPWSRRSFTWKCKGQVPNKKHGLKTGVILGQGVHLHGNVNDKFHTKNVV